MAGKSWGDLLGQAEAGPEPIPDGIYDFVVSTAKSQPAKTGAPMVVAVLKVVSGPYAGKTVWHNFVLTEDNPNALGWFFKHMAALGIDQSTIAALPPPEQGGLEQLAQMIVGRYVTANVGHRLWQGSTRNQLGDIKPYGGGAQQAPGVPQVPQQPAAPQYQPQPMAQPYPPGPMAPQPYPQPQPMPAQPTQAPTPYAAPYQQPQQPAYAPAAPAPAQAPPMPEPQQAPQPQAPQVPPGPDPNQPPSVPPPPPF
jgi:hypothetical protein